MLCRLPSLAVLCVCVVTTAVALAQPAIRPLPGRGPGGPAAPAVAWNEAEYVFTAKLDSVQAGPVANSFPPIYNHTLTLTVDKSLRGPLKAAETVSGHHAARQTDVPTFPVEKMVIVAAKKSREGFSIQRIEEFDDAKLKKITAACLLPLGWTSVDDKVHSPWASLGKAAWAADTQLKGTLACSDTFRPALLCGPGLKLEAEVAPYKPADGAHPEWTNPDGNGEYKITVTNTTDKAITVPALLSRGEEILWNESLVILCQGKAYMCPGAKGVSGAITGTTIQPGKSVSTIVNTFALNGPDWPKGGYRIEFQFCLGELSQTKSFYYMSRHHDPIREAVKAKK